MGRRAREEIIDVDEVSQPAKPKNTAAAAAASTKAAKATAAAPVVAPAASTTANDTSGGAVGVSLKQYVTDPEWVAALAPTFAADFTRNIEKYLLAAENAGKLVFPPRKDIFSALNVCPLSSVKVVIIGQDPYHDHNQAHGMCFSVLPGVKVPPSLANMYKELVTDIPGFVPPRHGYLMDWARQGVLLLNATLTVEAHSPNSHEKIGWQDFTDRIIDVVNRREQPVVFLLWGNFAIKKAKRVDRSRHKVIENAHPSPLSAAKWFGCMAFSKCNDALVALKMPAINWDLPVEAKV